MRKIFLMTFLLMILSIQSLCSAAEIYAAQFNGEENLVYPVVKTGDTAIDQKINFVIAKELDSFVTDVYGRLHYDEKDSLRYIDTDYTVTCNEAGGTKILSVIIMESYCYMRAAHPAYIRRAFNFNTATGELMDTNYLTNVGEGIPESDFLDTLTQKLREQCESRNIKLYNDALPLKKLPEDFYWDEDLNVHFIFQSYDVASYAYGIIDVVID